MLKYSYILRFDFLGTEEHGETKTTCFRISIGTFHKKVSKQYQNNSDENKSVNGSSSGGSGGSLAVALAVAKRTLERNLADLRKKGILSRSGNTSAGRWVLLKESK